MGVRIAGVVSILSVLAGQPAALGMIAAGDDPRPQTANTATKGSGVGELIDAGERITREQYGLERCNKSWISVLRAKNIDGDYAALILSRDQCVNLGVEIVALAHDSDPAARRRAAEILGKLKVVGAASVLGKLADDPDEDVAAQALRSICATDSVQCLENIRKGLDTKDRPKVHRIAEVLKDSYGPGPCESGWGYQLSLETQHDAKNVDGSIGATVSLTNQCSGAITVAWSPLPMAWAVRYYGRDGKLAQRNPDWKLGSVPAQDKDEDIGQAEYRTVRGGETATKRIDLRQYLVDRVGAVAPGCYGVILWYRPELSPKSMTIPPLSITLASQEVRVCVEGK
jgi:hypothetical protein